MFAATDTKLTLVPTPLAATLKADGGEKRIPVEPGLYIVNGKKIVVR